MLKGYQKAEAVSLILSRLYPEDYPALTEEMLEPLIQQCVDADFDYMIAHDILQPDGSDGDCYYNKRNAHCHIMSLLYQNNGFTEDDFDDLYRLVDDYMDYNRSYLELHGLSYHEDERIAITGMDW